MPEPGVTLSMVLQRGVVITITRDMVGETGTEGRVNPLIGPAVRVRVRVVRVSDSVVVGRSDGSSSRLIVVVNPLGISILEVHSLVGTEATLVDRPIRIGGIEDLESLLLVILPMVSMLVDRTYGIVLDVPVLNRGSVAIYVRRTTV